LPWNGNFKPVDSALRLAGGGKRPICTIVCSLLASTVGCAVMLAMQTCQSRNGFKLTQRSLFHGHHERYMVREREGNALRQAESLIKHHKEKAKKKLRERELNRLLIDIRKAGQARLRRIREHGLESCDL
jgi:hypothetical protein